MASQKPLIFIGTFPDITKISQLKTGDTLDGVVNHADFALDSVPFADGAGAVGYLNVAPNTVLGNTGAGIGALTVADLQTMLGFPDALTDADIVTGYNNEVPQVSADERNEGTQIAVRRFSPADIRSMAAIHGGGGGGGGADSRGYFEQTTPATTWTVDHNLGFKPPAAVLDTGGDVLLCDITHVNDNQLVVNHNVAIAGSVVW